MQRYILIRVLQGIVTLFAVSLIVFVLSRLSGDPTTLLIDPQATPKDIAELKAKLGLDRSYLEQYVIFITGAFRGDFGESIWYKEPALSVFVEKLPNTIELGLASLIITLLIAVPIGVISAVKKDTIFDQAGKIFALFGQSAPIFWLGIVLMLVFAVTLRLLPTSGTGGFTHLILPAVTLGWYGNALIMRITRSSMLDVLDTEYIKLARLSGLPEWVVIWKHALKNAAISIVTAIGLLLISLISGAVVTETVFAWPGVGRTLVESINRRDFPVIQTTVLLIAFGVVAINLLVDLVYAYIDPRIRYGE
jgi:peptide/nickel transport system permease protein